MRTRWNSSPDLFTSSYTSSAPPPDSNTRSFSTRQAIAGQATLVLGYPGIFEGWDLTVPLSYSQQFRGRTINGGVGGEGDKRYSLGATMVSVFRRNLYGRQWY